MFGETEAGPLQRLVESFHSLLDESLIVAIANDHDLHNASEYEAAYTILQGLAQDVPSEEATGFNPSGIHDFLDEGSDRVKDDVTASTRSLSEHASQSQETDTSSTSHTTSNSESGCAIPRLLYFNNDSEEGKILQLQGMFHGLKKYDVEYALKQAKGDFQTALDNLLSVQYLQSTGQQSKGVDGFFNLDDQTVARKKKKKKKGKNSEPGSQISHDQSTSSSHMKEFKDQSEIAQIAERFNISFDKVSDIYYEKDCSSGATVVEILDQHISQKNEQPWDDAGKKAVGDRIRKYRNVPEEHLQVIVQVTGSMSQFADDLAALANKHFSKKPRSQKLDLRYRLTPLPDGEIEGAQTRASGKGSVLNIKQINGQTTSPVSPNGVLDFAQAIKISDGFYQAKRDAAASAAQLHQRGRSSPLYRQAAGYYAEKAREQGRYAQEAMSTAADLLVEKQSTGETIDLHGVSVYDGVRIARQKSLDWWQSHGEHRGKKMHDHSLTIITGLGRHSANGVSQLRKAVAAALVQDGWKLRVETGKFVIIGR